MKLSNKTTYGRLRIVAGTLRSRIVTFPLVNGLRPTGSRLRETLFNWLTTDIKETSVLDLFAGSGALSFEAASRGARQIVQVEINALAVQSLMANGLRLNINNQQLHRTDALTFLQHPQEKPFDIIFIDPPFGSNLHNTVLLSLANSACFGKTSLIYLECNKRQLQQNDLQIPESIQVYRRQMMGNVVALLCCSKEVND